MHPTSASARGAFLAMLLLLAAPAPRRDAAQAAAAPAAESRPRPRSIPAGVDTGTPRLERHGAARHAGAADQRRRPHRAAHPLGGRAGRGPAEAGGEQRRRCHAGAAGRRSGRARGGRQGARRAQGIGARLGHQHGRHGARSAVDASTRCWPAQRSGSTASAMPGQRRA